MAEFGDTDGRPGANGGRVETNRKPQVRVSSLHIQAPVEPPRARVNLPLPPPIAVIDPTPYDLAGFEPDPARPPLVDDRVAEPAGEHDPQEQTRTSIIESFRSSLEPGEIQANTLPILITVSALAAVGAVLAGPSPTGGPVVDAILTSAFSALVISAAPRARRDAFLAMTAMAMVFTGGQVWLLAAVASFALALALVYFMRIHPMRYFAAAAVGAALALQGIMRFPGIGFTGSASLLAACAVSPVLLSALRNLTLDSRRTAMRVVLGVTVFAIIASGTAALAAFYGRSSAEAGIQRANDGIDAATKAQQEEAVQLLGFASGHFRAAANNFGIWWSKPSRLVPIVAQHARALEVAAVQGEALADAAIQVATTADLDQVRGDGGRIDIATLRSISGELVSTTKSLDSAVVELDDASSPWLLPLIQNRLNEASEQLTDASEDISVAADAAALMPGLLGGDGKRVYLVIFTNPAESREGGGFGGAYGILEADNGKLELLRSGRGEELNRQATEQGVADPSSYPTAYMNYKVEKFFGNLMGTPDFPTIARAAREIFPQMGGEPIDGVVALDPYALGALLELSGPIQVPGVDEPFSGDNVAQFLLVDQYVDFEGIANEEREDFLGSIAGEAFASLVNSNIPSPTKLGDLLGKVGREKRIMIHTFNEAENEFLRSLNLDGAIADVGFETDFISVIHDDAAPTKLDAYFHRNVIYDVQFDPDSRQLEGTLTIELRNEAPADLPDYVQGEPGFYYDLEPGTHRVRLSVYTNKNVRTITRDGVPVRLERYIEYERARTLTFVDVPRGETVTLVAQVTGRVEGAGGLQIYFASQPTVHADSVTVRVRPSPGWLIAGTDANEFVSDFELTEDTVLQTGFIRE